MAALLLRANKIGWQLFFTLNSPRMTASTDTLSRWQQPNNMLLRPFGWRDLPTLHRYRGQSIYLDSSLAATHGTLHPALLLGGMTALAGFRAWVCQSEKIPPLIGISHQPVGFPSATIGFLTPAEALSTPCAAKLLDQLAKQSGEYGAFHMLAEMDATTPLFETMRQAGFNAYTRQHIWVVDASPTEATSSTGWRFAHAGDQYAIQAFCRQIIPEYIFNVEPVATTSAPGLIYTQAGQVRGYAHIRNGRHGTWIKPVVHLDITNAKQILLELLQAIPNRQTRPIHLCIRAYQPHLEPALYEFGSTPGPEQTVMVKHLAVHHRARETFKRPNFEGQPETPAPLAHSKRHG
jgi:hypothetical protein